jgi:superfamily II DNA/RNA helicase
VPWQPDDYIHRIGRTGRAGATGIAITLATRADSDAVAGIEKLIGNKIPKLGAAPAEPRSEPEAEREAKQQKAREPEKTGRAERKPRPPERKAAQPEAKAQAPVRKPEAKEAVDDDSEWNGPLPDFLKVSAS